MSRKAAGRRETRSHDTSDPSLEYRDQTLYLYTFETIKKILLYIINGYCIHF